jgi:putative transposase
LVEERNDATLEESWNLLVAQANVDVSRSTVDRTLNKLDLTLKKRRSMPTKKKVSVSGSSV